MVYAVTDQPDINRLSPVTRSITPQRQRGAVVNAIHVLKMQVLACIAAHGRSSGDTEIPRHATSSRGWRESRIEAGKPTVSLHIVYLANRGIASTQLRRQDKEIRQIPSCRSSKLRKTWQPPSLFLTRSLFYTMHSTQRILDCPALFYHKIQ